MTDLEGAVERVSDVARRFDHKGGFPSESSDIRTILDALASTTRERDEAREAWTWLSKNTNLELDHRYEDEDDDGGTWRVHRVNGGVNDREWTLVAKGRTPLEAVQRARAAALVNGEVG